MITIIVIIVVVVFFLLLFLLLSFLLLSIIMIIIIIFIVAFGSCIPLSGFTREQRNQTKQNLIFFTSYESTSSYPNYEESKVRLAFQTLTDQPSTRRTLPNSKSGTEAPKPFWSVNLVLSTLSPTLTPKGKDKLFSFDKNGDEESYSLIHGQLPVFHTILHSSSTSSKCRYLFSQDYWIQTTQLDPSFVFLPQNLDSSRNPY